MRCLWITPQIPFPPFRGGDAIYSSSLIRALAEAGAAVTVVCNDNGAKPPEMSGVEWVLVPFHDRGRAGSLLSPSPSIVHRYSTRRLKEAVEGILRRTVWDAIVIDTLAVAFVFDPAWRSGARTPRLIYVSHNHEESVRLQIARAHRSWSPRRAVLTLDAWKAARLERRIVGAATMVTTTSQPDADRFRAQVPNLPYLVLTPGWSGDAVRHRAIADKTPRRVMLLGSYGWLAKQLNLEAFLRTAADPLADAKIGIDVVGAIPAAFAARLAKRFPKVRITGEVEDPAPLIQEARIGLVAETIGGGFKLKVLDYVFNRLPILALVGSVDGTSLVAGESILYGSDAQEMVKTIVASIDDFDRLNSVQQAAFSATEGNFDWAARGHALLGAMSGNAAV